MDNAEILSILQNLGARVPPASRLILIGGGALALLGSPRLTIDIDFIGDDVHLNPLHKTIMQIARELEVHVEPVPLERFIPLPKATKNASSASVNSEIWKSTLPTRTASPSANWIAAQTLTTMILSSSFKRTTSI